MKTEGQVRHKLQQVTYRHLQRAVRTGLSRRPENCIHNGCVRLPRGELHFCTLGEGHNFIPCDEAFGGLALCAKCTEFQRMHTKDSIRESFATFLGTSDVATIATEYPDIAALLWSLGEEGPIAVASLEETVQDPPEPSLDLLEPVEPTTST